MTSTPQPAAAHDSAPSCSELREALRCAASALKEHGPPFALAGSYALWAYGAPEPTHDVDMVVAESDVGNAKSALAKAGFQIEHPPEDWLFKARIGATVVDVLHRVNGTIVTPMTLDCAETRVVLAIPMNVLPPYSCVHSEAAGPHRALLRFRDIDSPGPGDPRKAGLEPHRGRNRRQRFRGCVLGVGRTARPARLNFGD